MANKGSRCSGTESVDILYNGIALRKDEGCIGDIHLYEADVVFPDPVTYEWTIDGTYHPDNPGLHPIVSTSPTYAYTFDDKTHTVHLLVKSIYCGAGTSVKAVGKVCLPECPVECVREVVDIPAGKLKSLVDNHNNTHTIPGSVGFICGKNLTGQLAKSVKVLNDNAAKAILGILTSVPDCKHAPISVKWAYNNSSRCITLTISNSPIKFSYIVVENNGYGFDTQYC